jgi:hypothetical protein
MRSSRELEDLLNMREKLAERGMSTDAIDKRISAERVRIVRAEMDRPMPARAATMEITASRKSRRSSQQRSSMTTRARWSATRRRLQRIPVGPNADRGAGQELLIFSPGFVAEQGSHCQARCADADCADQPIEEMACFTWQETAMA